MTNSLPTLRRRKCRRVLLVSVLTVGAAGALVVGCCTPQLMTAAITPSGPFDRASVPRAPDYTQDDAWLALPTMADEADVALPTLPAIDQVSAAVDVFYLHPTTSVAATWNAPFDNPEVRTAGIRGGTLIQASAFNGCCAVYAPTYRQATGTAFTTPSPAGAEALSLAFDDVRAAFDAFNARREGGPSSPSVRRPFILAGHSQGAMLLARLLRERIVSAEERALLVAVYLPGAALTNESIGGLHACAAPDEVGCVVTYNARAPGHTQNAIDMVGANISEAQRLCVNPVLGRATDEIVSSERHGGAVFFDAERPSLVPAFVTSQCANGRLVVSDMQPLPSRGAMSAILLWVMGGENFHPVEYQLFYADLRGDAQRRVAAFAAQRG